jgi:glycosyltransferase involved in cell wall biosynthesis
MHVTLATHQLPPEEPGGVGLFTLHLAAELRALGHTVSLLAGGETTGPPSLDATEPAAPGVRTLRLRLPRRARPLAFWCSFDDPAARRLAAVALRELAPDVLHVQHTLRLGVRLPSLALARGCAVVASIHDFWPICQRVTLLRPDGAVCDGPAGGVRCAGCIEHPSKLRVAAGGAVRLIPFMVRTQLVQGAYARAHELTCPSPSTARALQRAGFRGERLTVVDYGIPSVPAVVVDAPRPRSPLRFGYLGTLGAHKGLAVALRAAALAPPSEEWTLTVCGGPLRDGELRRALEVLCAAGRVIYRGPYRALDLPALLAELDAVVIPSLWPETGPMVCMEAAAAGLPVVASRIGALSDRVRHGEDGLLCEPDNPAALLAAMGRAVADYPRLRRGARGRTARSVADVALELEGIYERARRRARGDR